eukprot:scaffold13341_cov101-Isochrysis_galbana.AAC.17
MQGRAGEGKGRGVRGSGVRGWRTTAAPSKASGAASPFLRQCATQQKPFPPTSPPARGPFPPRALPAGQPARRNPLANQASR